MSAAGETDRLNGDRAPRACSDPSRPWGSRRRRCARSRRCCLGCRGRGLRSRGDTCPPRCSSRGLAAPQRARRLRLVSGGSTVPACTRSWACRSRTGRLRRRWPGTFERRSHRSRWPARAPGTRIVEAGPSRRLGAQDGPVGAGIPAVAKKLAQGVRGADGRAPLQPAGRGSRSCSRLSSSRANSTPNTSRRRLGCSTLARQPSSAVPCPLRQTTRSA